MAAASSLPVAVDVMGGDNAPHAAIDGAVAAARHEAVASILVGQEQIILDHLRKNRARNLIDSGFLSIVPASEVVTMDDKPGSAARSKRDSSMRVACELVKDGRACGVLSAGNSGAMMAVSLFSFGRIKGVLRPAIGAIVPHANGFTLIIDAGANIDCTPEYLLQFGQMGSVYMQHVYQLSSPRVAVLANGEEASKGNALTQMALELLKQSSVNCIGYCEGRDVMSGSVDVVVCDGFSGNIVLKTAEGTAAFLFSLIKNNFQSAGILPKLGALLSRPVFARIKAVVDPREFGAAPLIGLNAPALIAHGSSDSYAMRRAIFRVKEQALMSLPRAISEVLK